MGGRERAMDDVDGMINDRDCVIRPFLLHPRVLPLSVHLIDQKKAGKRHLSQDYRKPSVNEIEGWEEWIIPRVTGGF